MARVLMRSVFYIFSRLLLVLFLYFSSNNHNQVFDEVEWKLESIVKGEAGQVNLINSTQALENLKSENLKSILV